jgi:hypothetical protein
MALSHPIKGMSSCLYLVSTSWAQSKHSFWSSLMGGVITSYHSKKVGVTVGVICLAWFSVTLLLLHHYLTPCVIIPTVFAERLFAQIVKPMLHSDLPFEVPACPSEYPMIDLGHSSALLVCSLHISMNYSLSLPGAVLVPSMVSQDPASY